MSAEYDFDYCERCGEAAEGRYKVMFHGRLFRVAEREFYCLRCLRRMRVFAVVGFALLGAMLLGLVVATVVLIR